MVVRLSLLSYVFQVLFLWTSKISDQVQLAPNFWQVRLVVYQVKGGNTAYSPNSTNYHNMAPNTADGTIGASDISC